MNNQLYIDLLKNVLIDFHRIEYGEYKPIQPNTDSLKARILNLVNNFVNKYGFTLCRKIEFNSDVRVEGRDWPGYADSMIGLKRMNNIEYCVNQILNDNIPGDFIETGVWRGGATIFMKALLEVNGINDRIVWVADSFEGLPVPDADKYEADSKDKHHTLVEIAVSIETVKKNFMKYNLLDDNVKFLKGWFKDTLPDAPIEKLALIRLDGDMYESTMDGLVNLYPKLSPGGFIIIDDWGAVPGCQKAVIDYRNKFNIDEEIIKIDWTGVFWRKSK